ncbi:hypothetical protein [Streptomyces carpaticus]|uniref:hypothetical protein n=1 Tax=Streptomyces carpaticus TaxID=285558 RepID=UPI0031F9EA90
MNHCLACERELRDPRVTDRLCRRCTDATTARLLRMPGLYAALDAFLAPGATRPEASGTRPVEAPLPVREQTLVLRGPGGMVGVLEDWRRALHDDLEWAPPTPAGDTAARVAAAADALHTNMPWIASSWPQAGQFADEVRDLEAAALTIVSPQPRPYRIGRCVGLGSDGTECGANLTAEEGATEVRCPWCHRAWPPDTWLTLRAAREAA